MSQGVVEVFCLPKTAWPPTSDFDREIVDIVDYVMNYEITSKVAYDTAHY
ncbi:hypothetical protein, partial [Enterobacter hormaechei]